MRAAVYEQFRGAISIVEVPDPTPSPGEVVVRVLAVGLCRSDYHGWHGTDPDIVCPHVGGHEFVGLVVGVGAGVKSSRGSPAGVRLRSTPPFPTPTRTQWSCRLLSPMLRPPSWVAE